VEVLRAACGSLERLTQLAAHDDRRGEAVGVHLSHRRREQHVDPGALRQLRVTRLVPRVNGEVLLAAELGRVDEQRHHNRRALLARAFEQGEVTLVQGAHRRHETDGRRGVAQRVAQPGDRAQRLHAKAPSASIDAAACPTARERRPRSETATAERVAGGLILSVQFRGSDTGRDYGDGLLGGPSRTR
jgi:hypothetical protein